jgi:hypothetical protein
MHFSIGNTDELTLAVHDGATKITTHDVVGQQVLKRPIEQTG